MSGSPKSRSRRAEIRKNRPDAPRIDWQRWRESGALKALAVAAGFYACAVAILMLRQEVVPYRPDQWVPHDIVSRVSFNYFDHRQYAERQRQAREREPRVYRAAAGGDVWAELEKGLLALPERVANVGGGELPAPLGAVFADPASIRLLTEAATDPRQRDLYAESVASFVTALREARVQDRGQPRKLLVLPHEQRQTDLRADRRVLLAGEGTPVNPADTFSARDEALKSLMLEQAKRYFGLSLQAQLVDFALSELNPTHELDEMATVEAQNLAARNVPHSAGDIRYPANAILVPRSSRAFTQDDYQLLKAENRAYLATIPNRAWASRLGLAGMAFLVTAVLCGYVAHYQPRIVRNHARALALAGLLLSMLLVAQVAAVGTGPLYLFGVAPTLLVAMILAIAYDQRFAIGVASIHGLLATVALDQGVSFFIILWVGLLTACFLLDDIRTRSKLIEVGGATALAMIVATVAAAAMSAEPWRFVVKNSLFTGAAGLSVGFIVLGILPFIEKTFRITTSMTLLELADGSHPLLRRLAVEAPGTYAHSLQVATLAESAAEAVGANSLLCRVGSYYHDIGKVNKPDYFIENTGGGENRHLNLNPSVSFLIIVGHVKDGVELAKEYNLPTNLVNFIQQHHGTTLVEYFYHRACTKKDRTEPDGPAVPEAQYRYPGPKPRTKEAAIVMMADATESACRAMVEPTASRVEALVHELAMRRLLDGQFDECDLTIRDLERIERSLVKTLLGVYHGRIAYPSTAAIAAPSSTAAVPAPAARTA